MRNNKAYGPDGVPDEAIRLLMQYGEDLVLQTMNEALINGMPDMWRSSIITPIFKAKGSAMECSSDRGIKPLCHAMKLYERMVENRLRKQIAISSNQYGFRPGKSTMEPIFALIILQEKYLEKRKELHKMVFVDLEKAYARIPRDLIWWSLRKRGLEEHYYTTVIRDMYERSKTKVRILTGSTKEFQIDVGIHQGSALSPFLFIVILDLLTESIGTYPPNSMLFADDCLVLVIFEDTRDKADYQLERWRDGLERHGLKVSRQKTEYMPSSNTNDAVKLGEEEIPCTNTFKYLGSIFAAEGGTEADCKNRVRLSWNKWRETTGVICDKNVPVKLKVKIYQTVIKPTMLYGAECWSMRKKKEHLLNKTEMRILRLIQGISLKDHVRSEEIQKRLNVMPIVDQVTKRRLSSYGQNEESRKT